jgi:hypothetical protein
MPKHMAVKQGRDDDGIGWESRFLKVLATTESDHFVKLYKANHHMGRCGTSRVFDRIPFNRHDKYDRRIEVNRLHLEYCANGDLSSYDEKFRDFRKLDVYPAEEKMWRIFACLSRATLVLEKGSERLCATDLIRRTQQTLAIYEQLTTSGPPLSVYYLSVFIQPNVRPLNEPLVSTKPPAQRNCSSLESTRDLGREGWVLIDRVLRIRRCCFRRMFRRRRRWFECRIILFR